MAASILPSSDISKDSSGPCTEDIEEAETLVVERLMSGSDRGVISFHSSSEEGNFWTSRCVWCL